MIERPTEKKSACWLVSASLKLRSHSTTAIKHRIPSTKSKRNTDLQPKWSVCQPPSTGPTAGATLSAMPRVPIAKPRRFNGKIAKIVICSTGHMIPEPTASRMRPESTRGNVGASQARADPSVNTTIDEITICRVLNRFVRNAVSGTMMPMTS